MSSTSATTLTVSSDFDEFYDFDQYDAFDDNVLITVPIPRTPGLAWPGEGEVANVPAVLLQALYGRCTCANCCAGLAAVVRRSQLHAV
jgi:hypothetical protein